MDKLSLSHSPIVRRCVPLRLTFNFCTLHSAVSLAGEVKESGLFATSCILHSSGLPQAIFTPGSCSDHDTSEHMLFMSLCMTPDKSVYGCGLRTFSKTVGWRLSGTVSLVLAWTRVEWRLIGPTLNLISRTRPFYKCQASHAVNSNRQHTHLTENISLSVNY